ncbi:MAG: hypothetical protein CVU05_05030 [Bacteroidetes bacterium HGW-Bacteroidetes-21]|jgi:hypothetical protein|nr:MAG: hypothetical protein CVU05_05030 [Bacteroidetes bacterium HGW-Bacteroidetes-21]
MNEKAHFSEEEVAICSDAINEGKYQGLPETFRNHLAECDQCASEVLLVADIAFDFSLSANQNARGSKKRWFFIASITSVAAILIFAFLIFVYNPWNNSINEIALIQDTTSVKNIKENQINKEIDTISKTNQIIPNENQQMAAFIEDEQFEKLYESFKESYRGSSIEITTKGVLTYPQIDSLKWNNKYHEKLVVEFYTNKGVLYSNETTDGNGCRIPKFSSGLYYWKLINMDYELLYVGKIKGNI